MGKLDFVYWFVCCIEWWSIVFNLFFKFIDGNGMVFYLFIDYEYNNFS